MEKEKQPTIIEDIESTREVVSIETVVVLLEAIKAEIEEVKKKIEILEIKL